MDTRTGELYEIDKRSHERLIKAFEDGPGFREHFVPADKAKPGQIRAKKVGRNGPCPCGSGKKFKACCMGRAASASERRDLAESLENVRLATERLEAAKAG